MNFNAHRDNCFDIIRHFAAVMVLFSHHFGLSGLPEPMIRGWDSLGFIAVAIFFSISGYFMPSSYSNSKGLYDFVSKRCRRIFPGLMVCSFFMVYIIGLAFVEDGRFSYILSYSTFITFFQHVIFIHSESPALFSDFIVKGAINGSLWTLPIEFLCYLIIGSCLSIYFSWKTSMVLLWLSAVCVATVGVSWNSFSFYGVDARYLAIFGVPFATGALMSMTKDVWMSRKIQFLIIGILIIWLTRIGAPIFVFGSASLAAITIITGTSFKDKLINGRFDISYGIYIYAFPIQQVIINKVTGNFWIGMILALFMTVIAASLSFRYVESPFIRKKSIDSKKENKFSETSK